MTTEAPITGNDVISLIAHAASDDHEGAADVLTRIAEVGGTRGLYATSCALAEAIMRLCDLQPDTPEDFIGLEIIGPNGAPTNPGEVPAKSQAMLWAGQFVAAHANGDSSQTMALFLAAQGCDADPSDPEQLIARICGLINIAAMAVRRKS